MIGKLLIFISQMEKLKLGDVNTYILGVKWVLN